MEWKGRTSPIDELEKGERRPTLEPPLTESKPQEKQGQKKAVDPQNTAKGEPLTDAIPSTGQTGDEKSPYAVYCEPDAKIWQLYLKEAEVEDKEVTGIWNDSLDSLLVFAGLFAGVLTAFLIESLKNLKEDPQEALLQKIADLLGNASDPSANEPFQPDPSSQYINILWIISLTLTLLSALAAVLAKGWVAKYNPASHREQLSDACERILRVNRAQEWNFETVVTGIPLLIQASLFLFFAGLLIQIVDNNIQIWLTSLILICLAGLFYILGTVLPWFSPACPFQTPVSNFLPGGTSQGRYRDPSSGFRKRYAPSESWPDLILSSPRLIYKFWEAVREKPTQQVLRGQILSWSIANSTEQETIEEAMKAVAGSEATSELQDSLSQYGADEVLRRKLQDCVKATPGLPKTADDISRMEYLLYAHLHLEERSPIDGGAIRLVDDFLLRDGQALHRWDDFQPHLQALAFSLRVHMLVNRGQDDHEEHWAQTVKNLHQLAQVGAPPNIRNILFRATIRGLVKGRRILRKTCGYILSGQILIPDVRESLQNLTKSTEVSVCKKDERTVSNINGELAKALAYACISDDKDYREIGIEALVRTARYSVLSVLAEAAIKEVMKGLGSEYIQVRTATMRTLERLAECAEAHGAIRPFISQLINLLEDERSEVREGAALAIGKLAQDGELREAIKPAVPQLIDLLEDVLWDTRRAAASAIGKLANHSEFRELLNPTIPGLVDQLEDDDWTAREGAASAIGQLANHMEFHQIMRSAISPLVNQLKYPESEVRIAAMSTIGQFTNHAGFREAISPAIPVIIDQLEDTEWQVRSTAASVIGHFVNYATFDDTIKPAVSPLIDLLQDSDVSVSKTAIGAIGQFANHVEFHDIIRPAILPLINQLKDSNSAVRTAIASTFGHFTNHAELRAAIKPAIPQLMSLLDGFSWNTRGAAAYTIGQFVNYAELREDVKPSIPRIIGLLGDIGSSARQAGAFTIGQLANHVEFREIIKSAISPLINQLKDPESEVRIAAVSAIGEVAIHEEFDDIIQPAALPLINLLSDSDKGVRFAATSVIGRLTDYGDKPSSPGTLSSTVVSHMLVLPDKYVSDDGSARPVIRQLQDSFHGERSRVKFHGILIVSHIAVISRELPWLIVNTIWKVSKIPGRDLSQLLDITGHVETRAALFASMLRLQDPVGNGDQATRSSIPALLSRLLDDPELCDAVKPVIPRLTSLLADSEWRIREAAATAIGQLADHEEFHDDFKPTISQLLKLLKDINVRKSAGFAIAQLANHAFREDIKSTILHIIGLLGDSNSNVRKAAASAIGQLASPSMFHEDISPAIPMLIKQLKDTAYQAREGAASALAQLVNHLEFEDIVEPAVRLLIDLVKDSYSIVRNAAVSAIGQFANHTKFREDINQAIPELIKQLKGAAYQAREGSALAIGQLANHAEFNNNIKLAIRPLMSLLKDSNKDVRKAAVSVIGQLANHSVFHDEIKSSSLQLADSLKVTDWQTREGAASAIGQLANHVELIDTVRPAVGLLIDLLRDPESEVRKAAAFAVGQLTRHAMFHDAIKPAVPQLVHLLADSNKGICSADSSTISMLVEDENLPFFSLMSIGDIVSLLRHNERSIRENSATSIEQLLKYKHTHKAILESSLRSSLVELLQDRETTVLKPLVRILAILVDHGYMSHEVVHVALNALEQLDDADVEVQRCGATIISAMAPSARLRNILIEVGTIHASLQLFANASTQDARTIIERMDEFGVLKEL